MPHNPDPDEDVILDFGMVRQRLVRVFARDGVIDAAEEEVLDAFDRPAGTLSSRYYARRSFESAMRNGLTRRSAQGLKEAGIAVVFGADNYPANVIPFPEPDHGPKAA